MVRRYNRVVATVRRCGRCAACEATKEARTRASARLAKEPGSRAEILLEVNKVVADNACLWESMDI
jgi:hypothetical protein